MLTTAEYVDSQVANITVQGEISRALEQAKAEEITDDATAKEAAAIRADHSRTAPKSRAPGYITATSTASSRTIDAEKMYSCQLKRRWRTSAKRSSLPRGAGATGKRGSGNAEAIWCQVCYQRQITTQPESLRRARR